jgi:hypothetical protein
VLLHGHQILQRIHARLQTGGNHTGQDTGNVRTMFGGIEQGVLTLANAEFQRALRQIIVEGRAWPAL